MIVFTVDTKNTEKPVNPLRLVAEAKKYDGALMPSDVLALAKAYCELRAKLNTPLELPDPYTVESDLDGYSSDYVVNYEETVQALHEQGFTLKL